MPRQKLTRRADNLLEASVYVGKNENGKRNYKHFYAHTQKELDAKVAEFKYSMGKGLNVSGIEKFSDWSERLLEIKKREVSQNWYYMITDYIDLWNSNFGDTDIRKIKLIDIQDVINRLADSNPVTGKATSKETLRKYKSALSQVFNLAIDNRLLDYNPAQNVRLPKAAPVTRREALACEQIQMVIDTPHRAQTAAMIMLFAGLRRGELLALEQSDVDFKQGFISINKSAEIIKSEFKVSPGGKTENATRTVVIPKILIDHLRSCSNGEKQICNNNGKPHTRSSWEYMWKSYMKELTKKYGSPSSKGRSKFDVDTTKQSFETFTPHQLRHTYSSMLNAAGVNPLTIERLMGHSDGGSIFKRYTHTDLAQYIVAVKKFNEYVSDNFLSSSICIQQ